MKIEYLLQCRWMKTNLKNRVFLFFLWNIYIRSRLAEIRTTFPNENKTKMINFLEVFQSINEIFSENIDLDEKFQIKIVIRNRTINFKKSALKRLSWPLKTFLGRLYVNYSHLWFRFFWDFEVFFWLTKIFFTLHAGVFSYQENSTVSPDSKSLFELSFFTRKSVKFKKSLL